MTNTFKAPDCLHLETCDTDGNKRTIRYIREDHIAQMLDKWSFELRSLRKMCDSPERNE